MNSAKVYEKPVTYFSVVRLQIVICNMDIASLEDDPHANCYKIKIIQQTDNMC